MIVRSIESFEKDAFNARVPHPMQSYEWNEFRQKTGVSVERIGIFEDGKLDKAFAMTFHRVPYTNYTIGYVPKCNNLGKSELALISSIAQKKNALFVKIEPDLYEPVSTHDALRSQVDVFESFGCVRSKPQFSPYTFRVDISKSSDELLASFHQKTRYNINVAKKKGVTIVEDTTEGGLTEYLALLAETTKRQGFYAHSADYYKQMFDTLKESQMLHIFKAVYEGKTVSVWIIFVFGKTLYYPYGASSREHREVMANNLLAFEVMLFGQKIGCTVFDMWGCLGENPDPKDPWYGFHKFKEGYAGMHLRTIGAFDLILKPREYGYFQKIDALRWKILRLKAKLFSK